MAEQIDRYQDHDAEHMTLGAAFSDPVVMAAVRPKLAAADFGLAAHGTLWEAMCEAFDAGRAVDLVTVSAALKARNVLGTVSTQVRLKPLPYMRAPLEHAEQWAAIVAGNARARRLRHALTACLAKFDDPHCTADEFVYLTRKTIDGAAAADEGDGESWLEDDMAALQATLEAADDGKAAVRAYTTGLGALDRAIGGLRPGQLTLLAGKTGGGKSACALTMVLNAVAAGAPPVLFASLEMTGEDMAVRATAFLSGVPQSEIRAAQTGLKKLPPEWLEATNRAAQSFRRKVRLVTSGKVTIADLRARARRMQATEGLSFVVCDYLQLMTPEGRPGGSREREVAEISRGLKSIAMELKVPVVALSQLNRASDERETPVLRDLRESGSLEQDASAVVFLWPESDNAPEVIRIIVAKSRFGPPTEFKARFVRTTSAFEDFGGT